MRPLVAARATATMGPGFEGNLQGNQSTRPGAGVVTVVTAPFPGHTELIAVLAALAPQARVRALADLDALAGLNGTGGRLIVDVDHIALEDIGWIRRILAARPSWSLVCTGRDAGSRNARSLLAGENVRWLSWPPNFDDLRALTAPPFAAAHAAASTTAASTAPARETAPAEKTSAQSAAPLAATTAPPSPAAIREALNALAPSLGREHIAVLADISQRLELSFAALREGGRLSDAELESPSVELRRLLRFTRTLSCLVSPPPRGDEEFDLAGLIEEQLAALTLRARKGPRFQPRSANEGRGAQFIVKADRAAMALAFESLLQLARHCAGQGETVRVVYTPLQVGELSVSIEFPSGPLERLTDEQLADPAVLRERLPELWPSDISAAGAILASQGAELSLHGGTNGHVAARVKLTGVRANTPPTRVVPSARSSAGANDPFA